MCVIILTCVMVCADTTSCREVNGCSPEVPWDQTCHFCLSPLLCFSFLLLCRAQPPKTFIFFVTSNIFFFFFILGFLMPWGLHAEFILIFHFLFPQKILLSWQLSSQLHRLVTPTLQLLFWISQIAPVRSSDPSPFATHRAAERSLLAPLLCLVSRCLCGPGLDVAVVFSHSGPERHDDVGIPLTLLRNKKQKKQNVCFSKPD